MTLYPNLLSNTTGIKSIWVIGKRLSRLTTKAVGKCWSSSAFLCAALRGAYKIRSRRSCFLSSHDSYYCEILRDVLNNAVGAAHKSHHAVCTLTRTSSSSTVSKWSIYSITFAVFYLDKKIKNKVCGLGQPKRKYYVITECQCFHIIYTCNKHYNMYIAGYTCWCHIETNV